MSMIDFSHIATICERAGAGLKPWARSAIDTSKQMLVGRPHGRTDDWVDVINRLPVLPADNLMLDADIVSCHSDSRYQDEITALLKQLHPWRKGPFSFHGVRIDAEWRSYLKWRRIICHILPLENRRILDVGCGNGYFLWRMLGAGARCAIGIDPMRLYLAQFQASRHFLGTHHAVGILPLGLEDCPFDQPVFDTVFSMGVLYHRREPFEHLRQLKGLLVKGGQLVLETLIFESKDEASLQPDDRYARMPNVWHIPSISLVIRWLEDIGFHTIRLVDVTPTTIAEQRSTEWMFFQSLADGLDPEDSTKTIEGYPAPVRAVLTAMG